MTFFFPIRLPLFKNHEKHLAVVKALSKKGKGLTRKEILENTKFKSGGWFTKILEELKQCGFIIETQDIDKVSEDGLYRLVDEFTLFYYKFLSTKKKSLTGVSLANSQSFKTWSGFAFENLCIKHHQLIAEILGISGVVYDVYSFVDKGAYESTGSQIDMIIDRADDYLHIIEVKFYNTPYKMTKSVATNINNKIASLQRKTGTKKTIFTTFITVRGVEKNSHFHEVITNDIQIEKFI